MTTEKKVLISIHDVMPSTIDQTESLLGLVEKNGHHRVTLLVVPGHNWNDRQIDRLRRWTDRGHQLAGHGWLHQCGRIRGFRHRLHSLLISRDVAEHLSLTTVESIELIKRNWEWFVDQGLPVPQLYVPPAWAMRPIPADDLQQLPFEMIEGLFGILWTKDGSRKSLPLIGYEADSWMRSAFLTTSNRIARNLASLLASPLRISIHPFDQSLRLADSVQSDLMRSFDAIGYGDIGCDVNESMATYSD